MRDDKKAYEESTEEKILDAAFDVLQERTISGTRMAMIAQRADLFQSNIHYYYKSKRDLLIAVQHKVLEHCIGLRRRLREESGNGLTQRLDSFWGQKKILIRDEPRYDYAELDFWGQARVDEAFAAEIRAAFVNWRQEIGQMLDEYAPALPQPRRTLLAAAMVSMMEGASLQYLLDPTAFDLDEYFDYCGELVLREIRNEGN